MFVIPFEKIKEEVSKTGWNHDYEKYRQNFANLINNGAISEADRQSNTEFAKCMSRTLEAVKMHPEIYDYLKTRERMATAQLSPEDLDYGVYGNTVTNHLPPAFKNIDFNAIYTFGYVPAIIKIVSNEPDTVIYFNDGTKSHVACENSDAFDVEKGIYIALLKKAIGSQNLRHLFNLIEAAKPVESATESESDMESVCIDDWNDMPEPLPLD